MTGNELTLPWHEHRWENGTLDTLVVVGIYAYFLVFSLKRVLANFERFQLVVALYNGVRTGTQLLDGFRISFTVQKFKNKHQKYRTVNPAISKRGNR